MLGLMTFQRGMATCRTIRRATVFLACLVASGTAVFGTIVKPNVILVLADQWRFDAFGYASNPDVRTPHLDRFQSEAIHFVNAVSRMPVCSPMRASLLTGQRPLTHGVFINDVPLDPGRNSLGKVFKAAGYDTAYIGKWHVDGHGRSAFIPPERRQGFDFWRVLECTHNYNQSAYYGDGPEKKVWDGYDAAAQTRSAISWLAARAATHKPFLLVLAWGPPHDPYFTAPAKFRALYDPARLTLRPNVPANAEANTRKILAGYYSHCTALDDCFGQLRTALAGDGLAANTLLVFTSDHGDMLGSHGLNKKQKPYDESIRVPLLLAWPAGLGREARRLDAPINSEDIFPTLLGLTGLRAPSSVEGWDFSGYVRGGKAPGDGAALIECIAPFGEWERRHDGREYRGLRTGRFTYVRDLSGPWLLFDNQADPWQTNNLANLPAAARLQKQLDSTLARKLRKEKDRFLPGESYTRQWHYAVDANGTMPYQP